MAFVYHKKKNTGTFLCQLLLQIYVCTLKKYIKARELCGVLYFLSYLQKVNNHPAINLNIAILKFPNHVRTFNYFIPYGENDLRGPGFFQFI